MPLILESTFWFSSLISRSPDIDGPGVTVPSILPLPVPVVPEDIAVPAELVPGASSTFALPTPLALLPALFGIGFVPGELPEPLGLIEAFGAAGIAPPAPTALGVEAPAPPAFGDPAAVPAVEPLPAVLGLAALPAEAPPAEPAPPPPLPCANATVEPQLSKIARMIADRFIDKPSPFEMFISATKPSGDRDPSDF
jgi:hypothetical protein